MKSKRMKCGACGGEVFRLSVRDALTGTEMLAECEGCGSTSIVRPSTPKLVVIWGEHSEGVLERIEE
jgi:uncharacterized Zn finger protein